MSSANAGPLPPLPPKVKIPQFKVEKEEIAPIEVPVSSGFFYAGIQSLWGWWSVDLELLTAYLEPFACTPYDFGGKGAVNINFFNAAALYGMGKPGDPGISGFNETEVNVAAYATKVGTRVPQGMSLKDYLLLGEQTKRVGNFRLWVACDDAVAVAYGQQVYFENKFLCAYKYSAPSPNLPGVTTWDWTCYDSPAGEAVIYQATADTSGLGPVCSNMSEWIDISWDTGTERPVASRRNYFGLYETYFVPSGSQAFSISYGQSTHPMRHDLERLIGTAAPVAIQHFASPTCIAEASAYYADL